LVFVYFKPHYHLPFPPTPHDLRLLLGERLYLVGRFFRHASTLGGRLLGLEPQDLLGGLEGIARDRLERRLLREVSRLLMAVGEVGNLLGGSFASIESERLEGVLVLKRPQSGAREVMVLVADNLLVPKQRSPFSEEASGLGLLLLINDFDIVGRSLLRLYLGRGVFLAGGAEDRFIGVYLVQVLVSEVFSHLEELALHEGVRDFFFLLIEFGPGGQGLLDRDMPERGLVRHQRLFGVEDGLRDLRELIVEFVPLLEGQDILF